jgi:hypothetical protein
MVLVATLATWSSLPDLRIFLKTLQLWNGPTPPTVYLFQDAAVAAEPLPYRGIIKAKDALQRYSGLTRAQMERLPGKYGSLWAEFMAEKIALLEWVFACEPERAATEGVFFFDADICFLGPLPAVPAAAGVALSPHAIREDDEAKYGRFNGGFLWIRARSALSRWRDSCAGSRFYEQAALEVFQSDPDLYTFPIQCNYGWWRLYQASEPAETRMKAWGIRRAPEHSGITVEGQQLLSVHTHWGPSQGLDVQEFNSFVLSFLKKLSNAHPPAKELLRCLGGAAASAHK